MASCEGHQNPNQKIHYVVWLENVQLAKETEKLHPENIFLKKRKSVSDEHSAPVHVSDSRQSAV
ncbi:Kinesin-like protein KIF15 [Myotis brandtii]|uniref:Kinesin-like protein KIF15 n=1 Tax=Myotis brandtii TaxID=109478 RepID=S7NXQ0_MYOBR|nr:Kinesin-like protein KIF15 [Myotis brandtii]